MRKVDAQIVAKSFGRHQVEAMKGQGVIVTRYGKPTVAVISYAEYREFRAYKAAKRRGCLHSDDAPAA